jgi:hypothetical protein
LLFALLCFAVCFALLVALLFALLFALLVALQWLALVIIFITTNQFLNLYLQIRTNLLQ